MKKPDISANEFYNHFIGTENYYRYPFGLLLTDGVKAVADEENAIGFLTPSHLISLKKNLKTVNSRFGKLKELKIPNLNFLQPTETIRS
jgi:hypothetical protein